MKDWKRFYASYKYGEGVYFLEGDLSQNNCGSIKRIMQALDNCSENVLDINHTITQFQRTCCIRAGMPKGGQVLSFRLGD